MTRELLTAEEVAEMLGMSCDWTYDQVRRGRIPVVRLGRRYRFRREAIEDWLREMESGNGRGRNP
jgi:excisionase family DNA binding protein